MCNLISAVPPAVVSPQGVDLALLMVSPLLRGSLNQMPSIRLVNRRSHQGTLVACLLTMLLLCTMMIIVCVGSAAAAGRKEEAV